MDWWTLGMWVLIGIVAIVVDIYTSALLFVWFAIGAIAAIIALIFNASIGIQIVVFAIVSVILLIVGYPIAKKIVKKTVQDIPTMEQTYIGREFDAKKQIIEKASIKVDGIYWTVKNEGEPIEEGERFKITRIEGNKLAIKKL